MCVLAMVLLPMRNQLLPCILLISLLSNAVGTHMALVSGRCQSDQRSLLLQIKKSLIFNSSFSVRLSQWGPGKDCCIWGGVDCDAAGHVIALDLSNESISGGIESATGLFSLQDLQSLNLAFNLFEGTQLIPSRLANLKNLSHLNLSNAGFGGQIPVEISNLTRLVTLDLSTDYYLANYDLKLENRNLSILVQNLVELRELHLDGVYISAVGNEWCQALSSWLPNLQVLSLSNCLLSGHIDSSLANLQNLSVIRLSLNNLSSPFPGFLADFKKLTSLNLSRCELYGIVPENIFQVPTLETLDLSMNELLRGSLPEFPQNMALRTLILRYSDFSGTLPGSIGNLKYLSTIDLVGCNFTGSIPSSTSNLTQLVYIELSINRFSGSIPSFHMSKSLTHLGLSYNALTGEIASVGWEELSNLLYVDLGYNSLTGSVPTSLFAHPALQLLILASNQFEGQLVEFSNASSSVLGNLDLSGNRLEGPIPTSIFELTNLDVLSLAFNKFNGTVQLNKIRRLTNLDLSYNSVTVNTSAIGSFLPQLDSLILAGCNLRTIPNVRYHSTLSYLDLSGNQISGDIPNWIWEIGRGALYHLNLSHNFLEGLQEPYSVAEGLFKLDLHSNRLHGKVPQLPPYAAYVDYSSNNFNSSIPDEIGNFLFYTLFFSLSNNSIQGFIPHSICNASSLLVLDLSRNNLIGTIPKCLIGRSDTLGVLNLRRNNLTGTISDAFLGNCTLQTLNLNGNQLEGMIPKSLASCRELEVLDLGNNQISGTFPCWLENVSSLHVLILRSNKFDGNIGCPENNGSWPMLQIVDLASNGFSGSLPRNLFKTWEAIMVDKAEAQSIPKHLRFESLRFDGIYYQDSVTVASKGLEMELVKILTLFTSIDLSKNKFQGPIPKEIGLFKSLYVLNLSHNALTGPMPSSIGNLRRLESLDLSMNFLTGTMPTELASLNFLSVLNVSHNHLVGRIPLGTQLQSFSPTSFEGNEGLCGPPLTNDCDNNPVLVPSPSASSNEIDWKFVTMAAGFAIGNGAVVTPLIFSKKVNKWYDDGINKYKVKFGM